MPDHSFLDERYFVGNEIYNCPFCNRRHVTYSIYAYQSFQWSEDKACFVYFVECHSCYKKSMQLSFDLIDTISFVWNRRPAWKFNFDEESQGRNLDDLFFYSVPTSFFSLDARVPRPLRELLTEAEGCLKSNFLTGASACARKIIYELAILNQIDTGSYVSGIKALKAQHPEVEPTFFDTLLTIQQVTSSKVHENSYDGWGSKHVRVILASIREVLHEIYVVPALGKDRRREVLRLRSELLGDNPPASQDGSGTKP